jgi:hypothetical protein
MIENILTFLIFLPLTEECERCGTGEEPVGVVAQAGDLPVVVALPHLQYKALVNQFK